MSDEEVVDGYNDARRHKPLIVEERAHSAHKLALKDEIERRGMNLAEIDLPTKVVGPQMIGPEAHAAIIVNHGCCGYPYCGPKGHPTPAVKIDETVLVEDQSLQPTAELIELPQTDVADASGPVPPEQLITDGGCDQHSEPLVAAG